MTPQDLKRELEQIWEGRGVIELHHKVKWVYRKDSVYGYNIITCGRGQKVGVIRGMSKPKGGINDGSISSTDSRQERGERQKKIRLLSGDGSR